MPLTVRVPSVGCSNAAMARRKVVLPQPDGPMKDTKSPRRIVSDTSFSACTGPSPVWNVSPSPRASMMGIEGSRMAMAIARTLDAIPDPTTAGTGQAMPNRQSNRGRSQRDRWIKRWMNKGYGHQSDQNPCTDCNPPWRCRKLPRQPAQRQPDRQCHTCDDQQDQNSAQGFHDS